MKPAPIHGLLVIDKPGGVTSRDVVDRVLGWFPRGTRLGHTGTLDPLATGVLVLCAGVATRLTEYVQAMRKTYRAGLLLGARSDTDDADGAIQAAGVEQPPDRQTVTQALRRFLGEVAQVPPRFSAAKVTGRRAYDVARRGGQVWLEPRQVRIYHIEVLRYEYPRLELEVHCGKGTYIRSLARDLGEALGCGGLVQTLRRTRVGPFTADAALRLDADAALARAHLRPLEVAVAELPRLTLPEADVLRLRQGQAVPQTGWLVPPASTEAMEEVAVFHPSGALAAIAAADRQTGVLRPLKVFPVPAE